MLLKSAKIQIRNNTLLRECNLLYEIKVKS